MSNGKAGRQVVEAAQDGDESAWSTIYEYLYPSLLGYLRMRSSGDPENLLGEVFLRLARGIHRFQGSMDELKAYAMTIAVNLLRDQARRQAVRPRLELVDPATIEGLGPASPGRPQSVSAEHAALGSVPFSMIDSLFGLLTDDQQEVLYLRFAGDLSVAETAKVLDRTAGAVKQLQHRAIERLRDAMQAAPDDMLWSDDMLGSIER